MNNRYFWMCRNYYHTKCKARCVTSVDDRLQRVSKNHNHPPDCDRAQLMLMKRAAVQRE
nr:unnamed protein product [Callosobruchus analis]CAI5868935.1 unnamed protein product [Callosobruchus analis]